MFFCFRLFFIVRIFPGGERLDELISLEYGLKRPLSVDMAVVGEHNHVVRLA